jgi:serralysin
MPSLHLPTASSFPARAIAFLAAAGLAHAQAGDLDLTLNGGHLVTTQQSTNSGLSMPAYGVAAGNGRVLVVGRSQAANGNVGWSVIRYEADGDLDTTFDGDGRVELFHSTYGSSARDVVVYPDGRILVAGEFPFGSNQNVAWQFGVVRLHDNGSLDTSFGSGGVARVSFGNNRLDQAKAVVLQADGRIVVAGSSNTGTSSRLALARLTASGQLDSSYGKNGKAEVVVSNQMSNILRLQPGCMALDGSGRIVVGAGLNWGINDNDRWRIARFTVGGKLDNSFGSGGIVTDSIPSSFLFDVAISAGGQIVTSGTFGNAGRTETAVVRYLANGARDASFGIGGLASTIGCAALPAGLEFHGNACRVQTDGKVVVGGYTLETGGARYMAPFRFAADGARDALFGVDGLGEPAAMGPSSLFQGYSLTFDDQDRLVIGGGDHSPGSGVSSVGWMRWL